MTSSTMAQTRMLPPRLYGGKVPCAFTISGGTTPSVNETNDHGSLQKDLSQTGTYTLGGDKIVLSSGNAASVSLGTGTSRMAFMGQVRSPDRRVRQCDRHCRCRHEYVHGGLRQS